MSTATDYQIYIRPLKKLAKESQAELGGVGCFIVKNGSVISSGINHNPTGEPMEDIIDGKLVSRPEIVHAEVAAIQAADTNKISVEGAAMLLTMSPCIKCAHAITQTNIAKLYYLYDWWDAAAIEILQNNGIKVIKMKEAK